MRFKSVSTVEVAFGADDALPPPAGIEAPAGGQGPLGLLYGPYLDLREARYGALHARGVDLAFRNVERGVPPFHWHQQVHPPAFRPLLARHLNAPPVAAVSPRDALAHGGDGRTGRLLEWLDHVRDLSVPRRVALAKLLVKLGFDRYALELFGEPGPVGRLGDDGAADLAYILAAARSNLATGYAIGPPGTSVTYWPGDLERLAREAPPGSRARMSAAMLLCVLFGKIAKDADAVARYAAVARAAHDRLDTGGGPFHRDLLRSQLLRAVSFEPMLRGDRDAVTAQLDEAEELARGLCAGDPDQELLRAENLATLMETRTREAQWRGDLDLAEARVRESVALNELDPMRHIVLGEVLKQRGDWPGAAAAFERSARLGPSTSPVAWFMAGYARERLGDPEHAVTCYLSCLALDPGAVSATLRLRELLPRTGLPGLAEPCLDHLRSALRGRAPAGATGPRRLWDAAPRAGERAAR
ncbi:tetratricopeptide repeat protein [Actinomadura sp. ATCC 31491]|uniref:Tetratricopeptide repeat protein n=1 Tax=Actinomadura luzonensis TaxID=2805427 RepID=A0ABT0FST1_9ACTN|nr:tetratricopeptide repeat protein [Actinomadura luzonensis]MCK2215376.1 tetratricopeptide repeat protein [Actinomadura luzonensis]